MYYIFHSVLVANSPSTVQDVFLGTNNGSIFDIRLFHSRIEPKYSALGGENIPIFTWNKYFCEVRAKH